MSILLDALRKSEERRRLGQAPDIHSPEAGGQAQASSRRWWLWGSMIALVGLVAAWVGWQQLGTTETVPGAAVESAAVAGAGAESAAGVEAEPAQEPAGSSPVSGVVAAAQSPVESLSADQGARTDAAVTSSSRSASKQSRVNRSFTEFQAPQEEVAEAAPGNVPAAGSEETPVAAEPATPAEKTLLSDEARPRAPENAAPGAPDPRTTEPISFWELPQKIRDSLPDLRITVLVYAERPEDRFLLMAGNRVVEKDQLPDGVVLDEIRRDGAVFTYRNYRFLVKG